MRGTMAMTIFQAMIKTGNGKNHFWQVLTAIDVSLAHYLNIMAIYSILGMGLIWSDIKTKNYC